MIMVMTRYKSRIHFIIVLDVDCYCLSCNKNNLENLNENISDALILLKKSKGPKMNISANFTDKIDTRNFNPK